MARNNLTPFGEELRRLRDQKAVQAKDMAAAIGVTPAYLSALEHGGRGKISFPLLQRIITYFGLIWDDAEKLKELAALSHPRVVVDTEKATAQATLTANLLARHVSDLSDDQLDAIQKIIKGND